MSISIQPTPELVTSLYEIQPTVAWSIDRIDCAEMTIAVRRLRDLRRQLGDNAHDPDVDSVTRQLSRMQFRLTAAPIPFDDPFVYDPLEFSRLRYTAQQFAMFLSAHAERAIAAVDAFQVLAESGANPLMDRIAQIMRLIEPGRVGLLVKESSLVAAVNDALQYEHFPGVETIEVVTPPALRSVRVYDHLIIVGPRHRLPNYIMSVPRASFIHCVGFACIRDRWTPTIALPGAIVGRATRRAPVESPPTDTFDDVEPSNDAAWAAIERFTHANATADVEAIDARLCALAGEEAVLLDVTQGASVLTLDIDDDVSPVERIPTLEVQAGIFVLLRTEGSGDYIVTVADEILGSRALQLRAMQEEWKRRLRTVVRDTGLFETALRLYDFGSTCADEQNVRNWMSSRNIRTALYADFLALMQLVDLESEAKRYWSAMGEIRNAHQRAGSVIRRQLLAQVRNADLDRLDHDGRIAFELGHADGGTLTAFRVERVFYDPIRVLPHRTDRPFKLDDIAWLG